MTLLLPPFPSHIILFFITQLSKTNVTLAKNSQLYLDPGEGKSEVAPLAASERR